MPSAERSYEPRERRLVSEWTRQVFPNAHVKENVRLGRVLPASTDRTLSESELRALGVYRRYADALVIEPATVHIVEGKIRNQPGAIEQLNLYAVLLPQTPELQDLTGREVVKHLVWCMNDPVVEALARQNNIRVHVFKPPWVDEYFATLRARQTRPVRPGLDTRDLFEDR